MEQRKCEHPSVSAEDAGFAKDGVRQVVAVCHDCGATTAPYDTVDQAHMAFMVQYPDFPEVG